MHVIRTQRHTLEESDFVFSPENKNGMAKIEWEGDNEFCLNGEMYDVIERRTAGDKLLIRCLADKKETDLLNKMSDSWKENDKSNKIVHDLFNILQGLFHQSLSDQICVDGAIGKQTAWLVLTLPPGIRRIPSQPPQS